MYTALFQSLDLELKPPLMLASLVTDCIIISVLSAQYIPEASNVHHNEHTYRYTVRITNLNKYPVQIKGKKLFVSDNLNYGNVFENGYKRTLESRLNGQQPIINCGDHYEYSAVQCIRSEMGCVMGMYCVEQFDTKEQGEIPMPSFDLITPSKFN
jgi:ApaG protein